MQLYQLQHYSKKKHRQKNSKRKDKEIAEAYGILQSPMLTPLRDDVQSAKRKFQATLHSRV
jgi:hypothetical protein